MEIKREYLDKYMDSVAIDQIADEYSNKGYRISKGEPIGNAQADLIARKDNETIIIEVKSGKMTPQKKAAIAEISNLVKKKDNYKFFVVFANPPKKKHLEVSNIDKLLENYMTDYLPEELDQLSAHTRINEVTDISINEIKVQQDGSIFVNGNGIVNATLQLGPGKEQDNIEFKTGDNFSFDFNIILQQDEHKKFTISEVMELNIDTSSYDI